MLSIVATSLLIKIYMKTSKYSNLLFKKDNLNLIMASKNRTYQRIAHYEKSTGVGLCKIFVIV